MNEKQSQPVVFSVPRWAAEQVRDPQDRQTVVAIVVAGLLSSTLTAAVVFATAAMRVIP